MPFEVQTVSPVTEFEEHEFTTFGVETDPTLPLPSSGTTRIPSVAVTAQLPFGTYAVTGVVPEGSLLGDTTPKELPGLQAASAGLTCVTFTAAQFELAKATPEAEVPCSETKYLPVANPAGIRNSTRSVPPMILVTASAVSLDAPVVAPQLVARLTVTSAG